ncbi:MAG TPA: hypothetical protein VKS21_10860 [Spirochaetota bacterium]|nr:hypothetical protein [Spirochaetota bacterium]
MKQNIITKIIISLLFFASGLLLAQAATVNATPSGTVIFSTNTEISYTNASGTSFSTNGEATNNTVQAIYGFTNQITILNGATNSATAGNSYYYVLSLTNYANTATTFNFLSNSTFSGSFGSPWPLSFCDAASNALGASTLNLAQSNNTNVVVQVQVDAAAANGAVGQFWITNFITMSNRAERYTSTNGNYYGGLKMFTDTFAVQVNGPEVTATKSIVYISNSAGGSIGANELIPGAEVRYRISYTNRGGAAAHNVQFVESLDNAYVDYLVGTQTGGDNYEYSDDNRSTWVYGPGGVVDNNVTDIRFTVNNIAINGSGNIEYTVVVK